MIISLITLSVQTGFSYILCYFGSNLTSVSAKIAERMFNSNWYLLNKNEQRLIAMIIRRGQVPFHMTGQNIIECSMPIFLMVNLISFIFIPDRKCFFFFLFSASAFGLFVLRSFAKVHLKIPQPRLDYKIILSMLKVKWFPKNFVIKNTFVSREQIVEPWLELIIISWDVTVKNGTTFTWWPINDVGTSHSRQHWYIKK